MRTINIALNAQNTNTGRINLLEGEDYILLELHRHPNLKTVFHTLANYAVGHVERTPTTGETFVRGLAVYNNATLEVDGNFLPNESVTGTAYIGSWSEVLLTDVSKNLNYLYQEASGNQIEFRIGPANRTNLHVIPDGFGNYQIVRTLTLSPTEVTTTQDMILNGTPLTTVIESIYSMIIANYMNPDFEGDQALKATQLIEQTFEFLRNY